MVDVEALARRSRRAAEWGRLRAASRIAVVVVPLVLAAGAVGVHRSVVAGLGVALLGVCVALGWRDAAGARAARSGLALGAVPMALALLTVAVEGWCDPDRAVTLCGAGCLLAGLVAGGGSAYHALRAAPRRPLVTWAETGLVACLTVALGCVGLGLGSALAVIAAVVAGALAAWVPARIGG
jgi:hypothetical protein